MAALCGPSDCPSCKFCPHSSDVHHDCPTIRRVSQPDSDALDVRSAVHLLQVRHQHEPPRRSAVHHLTYRVSYLLFSATSNLLTPWWNTLQSVYSTVLAWGLAAWREGHSSEYQHQTSYKLISFDVLIANRGPDSLTAPPHITESLVVIKWTSGVISSTFSSSLDASAVNDGFEFWILLITE